MRRALYIEPFDGGSHAAFTRAVIDGLGQEAGFDWTVWTLPGRHWKWRMRGSAAYFADRYCRARARTRSLDPTDPTDPTPESAERAPESAERAPEPAEREPDPAGGNESWDVLLASSYLNLAELKGLAPELTRVPAVLYFHENQFAYPVRRVPGRPPEAARDQDYGFTQMVSALAAEALAFNSEWNRDSFLEHARELLRRLPDAKVGGWIERLSERSRVIGYPMALPSVSAADFTRSTDDGSERSEGPLILWNHRWEHDKSPEIFFAALRVLQSREVPFRVAVCGERYREVPPVFEHARGWLEADRIAHWGFIEDRAAYESLLRRAHLVVSTASHEFFGVSVLEATHCGARPLVPDRLSYRELFPEEYRYGSDGELFEALELLCAGWVSGTRPLRRDRRDLTERWSRARVLASLSELLVEVSDVRAG